jgi:hypothetical protein
VITHGIEHGLWLLWWPNFGVILWRLNAPARLVLCSHSLFYSGSYHITFHMSKTGSFFERLGPPVVNATVPFADILAKSAFTLEHVWHEKCKGFIAKARDGLTKRSSAFVDAASDGVAFSMIVGSEMEKCRFRDVAVSICSGGNHKEHDGLNCCLVSAAATARTNGPNGRNEWAQRRCCAYVLLEICSCRWAHLFLPRAAPRPIGRGEPQSGHGEPASLSLPFFLESSSAAPLGRVHPSV